MTTATAETALGDGGAPLLQKVYNEGCPGCEMDKRKDTVTGIPYKEFVYVWITTLTASLPVSSLFPFLYFMIRDFHVAKKEEDIGYYAGFIGSSFMFGRTLTSVLWGIIADRYGRKPVILIGCVSVIIFNTLFGLSTTFSMAITTRLLLGSLNGLLGPVKAYSTEICRPEHQALGVSLITTSWGIGLIIGPAIGGYFSQPAEKYPKIFSKVSLFGRFPYFLPCLIISLFATCTFVASLWLPESLHTHKCKRDRHYDSCEASVYSSGLKESKDSTEKLDSASQKSILKNWPLISSIIVYCVFSFHDMAYTEIFSLWAVSDKKYGGLSFSTEDVGDVLTISGFSLLAFQLFLYRPFERLLGPIMSARVSAMISIMLLSTYCLFYKLSGFWLKLVVNCASMMKNVLSMIIITGMFILQNNSVEQHQRGAANGLAMTTMSLCKAAAPTVGGVVFSIAQQRQDAFFLPGDQLVFFGLIIAELLGLLLTFKPFLIEPNSSNT